MPKLISHDHGSQKVLIKLLPLLFSEISDRIVLSVLNIRCLPLLPLIPVHEDLCLVVFVRRDSGGKNVLNTLILDSDIDNILRVLRHRHLAKALNNQQHSKNQHRFPVLLQISENMSHEFSLSVFQSDFEKTDSVCAYSSFSRQQSVRTFSSPIPSIIS